MTTTVAVTITGLAVGTWLLRVAGVNLAQRATLSPHIERLLSAAAVAVLAGLAVTATVFTTGGEASPARILAVLAAVGLAWRRAPLPVIVAVGAGGAALLRAAGMA